MSIKKWETSNHSPPFHRSQLKFFGCVENEPLIRAFAGEEVYVMDRIPIPPLHTIKLGPVNHLVRELASHWDGLKPALASLNIKESDYFGGAYEGKQCTQILKKIELLNIPPEHKPFEVAFLALRELEYMASKVNCPTTASRFCTKRKTAAPCETP